MSVRESLITKVVEAGGKLTVRSALNPILWLCLIVTVPILASLPFIKEPQTWLVWMAFFPVAAAIIGFFFLLLFDRDKLQSESYQIRKRELEIIEQKGQPAIPAIEVEVIANPEESQKLLSEDRDYK